MYSISFYAHTTIENTVYNSVAHEVNTYTNHNRNTALQTKSNYMNNRNRVRFSLHYSAYTI